MRNTSLILILGFIHFLGNSQSFNVHVGNNWSKVVNSNAEPERHTQFTPAAGISLSSKESNLIKKIIEVQYSVKGYRTKGAFIYLGGPEEVFSEEAFNNFRQHYIDILPQVGIDLTDHLTVIAGANIGVNLLDTYNGEETLVPIHNTLDVGVLGGLKLNHNRYSLRLLANQGLTNAPSDIFITDNDGNTDQLLKYQNFNIQMTLGFRIVDLANDSKT